MANESISLLNDVLSNILVDIELMDLFGDRSSQGIGNILLETGDNILLEDGSYLLVE